MRALAPVRLRASGKDSKTTSTGWGIAVKAQIGVTDASNVPCAISQSLMISWVVSVVSNTTFEPSMPGKFPPPLAR